MNRNTIIKSTIAIIVIAILCFGIMGLLLFRFNKADVGAEEGPFNSSNAQTLIGTWDTTGFRTSDGYPMQHEGIVWVFTESEVRYFENGVEVMGRPFVYQWTNNDTIRMTDGTTGDQRIWRITFNDSNNIIVNEPNGYIRTLIRTTGTE